MSILNRVKKIEVSPEVKDYKIMFFGQEKAGKSSMCYQAYKAAYGNTDGLLFLGFENGYSALQGANALDIFNWKDVQELYKAIIKDVKAGKNTFDVLVWDTADIAVEMAENYIVELAGEKSINAGSLSYGK